MAENRDVPDRGGKPARRLTVRAPAKVNLHLEVLRHRDDGYHEIESILQAVSLWDVLDVELRERWEGRPPRIELTVDPYGAAPETPANLVWRAVAAFCEETGASGHFRLALTKEIPVEAGLGGGSSDAAAALVACDRLCGTRMPPERLEALAARIGSDAPFFVRGGTQLARGTGTDLAPLPPLRKGSFLIVKPDIALRTPDVYAGLNMGLTLRGPKVNIRTVESLIARFPRGSWIGTNRLEDVVLPSHPILQRLVQSLREQASVALMCGSGSAVFAVFVDDRRREIAKHGFDRPGWFVREVELVTGGVRIMEDPDQA